MKNLYYAARGYVLVLFLAVLSVSRFRSDSSIEPLGLTLVFIAAIFRLWSGFHIGPHSNGIRLQTSPRAVTGPYRWNPHPLYVSNLLAAAGLIVFANSLPMISALALWLAVVAHHGILIRWENAALGSEANPAQPVGWKTGWARQGRNLAYSLACVLILLALAGKFWLAP